MDKETLFLLAAGALAIGAILVIAIRARRVAAMATKVSEEAGGMYFATEGDAKTFIRKQDAKYGTVRTYSIERLQDGRFEVVPEKARARAAFIAEALKRYEAENRAES
jgi:hypothetical protein